MKAREGRGRRRERSRGRVSRGGREGGEGREREKIDSYLPWGGTQSLERGRVKGKTAGVGGRYWCEKLKREIHSLN